MKTTVLLRKNIDSGGPGVSRNRYFSGLCSEAGKSALFGGTFADFSDFGEPFGDQWGSKLTQKVFFFGGRNFDRFLEDFGQGPAAGVVPSRPSFEGFFH